ncbi:shikimate O-hydroxycinnamoyltransferase, partial [Tanacetum coccineum]
ETELDGEANFGDVARSGIDISGLTKILVSEVPVSEEAYVGRTEEHVIEQVIVEDVIDGDDHIDVVNPNGFDNDIGNDSFDNDIGNDNETSNYMRRRLDELRREMKGVMNANGQWMYSFYTRQKFASVKEAKDIVYLHSIESRRMLKLYKSDNVRVRARCEGKVLVFLQCHKVMDQLA